MVFLLLFVKKAKGAKMRIRNARYTVAASVVMAMALAALSSNAVADPVFKLVVQPNEVVGGRTYADWSAAWWQWAYSLPYDHSPVFDTAPCDTEQSGPVFFLAGKACGPGQTCGPTTTRSCTVPAGKGLYFPIQNFADSVVEEAGPAPFFGPIIAKMRKGLAGILDAETKVDVVFDSKHLPAFRMQSVGFDVTVPDHNFFQSAGEDIPAGTYAVTVDDGLYLMLEPPTSGKHKLHFTATNTFFGSPGITQDVTYNLNIE